MAAYEMRATSISVQFRGGDIYDYTYESAGREHVEQMKLLAEAGRGLNSFITKHVKHRYASKR